MRRNALIALAYACAGGLALLLAIPPGFASPLFFPAGIAVATVLRFGPRVLPATFAGSLIINIALGLQDPHRWTSTGALAILMVAIGATFQAWVGARLIARTASDDLALDSGAAITRFMLLGGPLSCLVNASWSTLSLHLFGLVPAEQLLFTWANWWIGDAVGVAIVAPICLTFIGEPRSLWRPRRLTVALPIICITLIASVAVLRVGNWERERALTNFKLVSDDLHHRIETRLHEHLLVLQALRGVFVGSEDVTRREFRQVADPWLLRYPSIQAMGVYTLVEQADLAAFVAARRDEGLSDFEVFDRGEGGQRRPVRSAPRYEVLTYIEPLTRNRAAIGLSADSIDLVRRAIDRSALLDAPVVTRPFRLTQETGHQLGVVVYWRVSQRMGDPTAVHPQETHPASELNTVFVTMRLDDLLNNIVPTDAQASVCLMSGSQGSLRQRYAGPAGCELANSGDETVDDRQFQFADDIWTVRVTASAPLLASQGRWSAWFFAASGMLAVGLLCAFLLLVTGRTLRVEELVRRRTAELEREIAEHRKTETALRNSHELVRSIIDAASVGLTYCAPDGRFMHVNQRFCDITGYTPEQLNALTFEQITHPDDVEKDKALYDRLIAGEIEHYDIDKRYVKPEGAPVWVHTMISLNRDPGGEMQSSIAVVEDISERYRLREAERAREMAEAANLAKSEFLSRMSHELRTPLNAMLGFAQLLAADVTQPLTPNQLDRVDRVQRAGWHLLEMINEVLDLSRIEAGAVRLSLQPVDLVPMLDECATMLAPQREQRGLRQQTMIEPGTPRVMADPTRLRQVLTNLFSNALKYNRPGGSISIRAHTIADDQVELEIDDTGIGMTPEQVAQLFQPFNRLGRDTSGEEGTGIGLVITKRLVELMQGELSVFSRAGQGTRCIVRLPIAHMPADMPATSTQPRVAPAVYGPRRVLYIEDNPVNAEVMRSLMDLRPQIELIVAETAAEGLEVLRQTGCDLLLLDMNLPDAHGLDVLKEVRETPQTAHLPVLVVSADALEAQIQRAMQAGADGYVTKPFSMQAALECIDEMLARGDASRKA